MAAVAIVMERLDDKVSLANSYSVHSEDVDVRPLSVGTVDEALTGRWSNLLFITVLDSISFQIFNSFNDKYKAWLSGIGLFPKY